MVDALEAVRMGQMSINQAAIHFNLPYSSLYGRFKRVKYEADHPEGGDGSIMEGHEGHHSSPPSNQSQSSQQSHHTTSQQNTPQPQQQQAQPQPPPPPPQQQTVNIQAQHITTSQTSHLGPPAQIMLVQYPSAQLQMYSHSS
ncbi:mediator of RNA polymerase II transcription subunit 15-like isoform X3 [Diaphorina citri]|uniref:Mediator of RNA polymerase II transcription subunit 15-like isoform X3 n=1 Tax=Diaphorina citri TaxID=121845 RepID=A0A3Q0IUS5_DIACI|nr:mediator of RNA polymerase II transcription subunit 15-like isoform X3 [Diaphorina citri]KAI5720971.1 hypothetical protein M8J77_014079 [Diaphorina citri]